MAAAAAGKKPVPHLKSALERTIAFRVLTGGEERVYELVRDLAFKEFRKSMSDDDAKASAYDASLAHKASHGREPVLAKAVIELTDVKDTVNVTVLNAVSVAPLNSKLIGCKHEIRSFVVPKGCRFTMTKGVAKFWMGVSKGHTICPCCVCNIEATSTTVAKCEAPLNVHVLGSATPSIGCTCQHLQATLA